ncbi:hypothetical protein MGSAQ_000823, partial [marine sediment metagenome]
TYSEERVSVHKGLFIAIVG